MSHPEFDTPIQFAIPRRRVLEMDECGPGDLVDERRTSPASDAAERTSWLALSCHPPTGTLVHTRISAAPTRSRVIPIGVRFASAPGRAHRGQASL